MARQIKYLRWYIAVLIFLVTVINYLDRQALAVTIPVISKEFNMSNTSYANVVNAFMLAYMISLALGGRLIDRVGPKVGFGFCVALWSVAGALHALARSTLGFGFFRFLLGLGEGGNYPAGVRVISEWFPPHEKAFAAGIFNSGAAIGAMFAPPVIGYLTWKYGWRPAYVLVGAIGFIWLIGWLLLYEKPEKNKWLTEDERKFIFSFRPPEGQVSAGAATNSFKHRDVLRYRQFWGMALSRFLGDVVWWFMILWFPKYLVDARGFSTKEIALFAWIPFLGADVGNLVGGGASSLLIRHGLTVNRARKTALIVLGILTVLAVLGANRPASAAGCLVLITIATFAYQGWIANIWAMPSDVFPVHVVAFVTGLGGFASGVGTLSWNWYVGFVTDKFPEPLRYNLVFGAAGILMALAVVVMSTVTGKIAPVVTAQGQK